MPVTPFHFGPGLFIKSLLQKHFSIFIFVFTQVIMDIEPVYFIITRQYPVHRFAHTYLGATIVAIICTAIGRPIRKLVIRYCNRRLMNAVTLSNQSNETISYQIALATALIGVYSHVLLDSIMHPDIKPLNPLSTGNILFQTLSLETLHLLCVVLGLIGIVVIVIGELMIRWRKEGA